MDSRSGSERFPGFAHFYSVSESESRAFRADLELPGDDFWPFFTGEMRREKPIRAHWFMGAARPVDIIWTGFAVPLLISERVVQILRDGGFTGWDVTPVELGGKRGEPVPGYYFLSILGRSGPIDKGRSETFDKLFPARAVPYYMGLYFDPATWDGSDIFLPEGTGYIFVVEPVKRALVLAKVKNLEFTRLDQVEHRVSYGEPDPG